MRNEQAEYTGKDQADEIGFRRLAESRHKKYADRYIYRPPDDLAPPISGNVLKHMLQSYALACHKQTLI